MPGPWAGDVVIFVTKRSFAGEVDRLREAIEEVEDAGWCEHVGARRLRGACPVGVRSLGRTLARSEAGRG